MQTHSNQTHDTSAAQTIIGISRHWLEVTTRTRPHQIEQLQPAHILTTLQSGGRLHWQGWTIQATPPRHIPTGDGRREWASGIWASSTEGFTTGKRIDLDSVSAVCDYILKRKAWANQAA